MFSRISDSYDAMNHILSVNFDKTWREIAAREAILPKKKYSVLDIAAGTGDLSLSISRLAEREEKELRIFASDINKEMLEIARRKIKLSGKKNITILLEDALDLNHKSGSVDVVTSAFGLRSLASIRNGKGLEKFVKESYRVLNKGGRIVLLDMASPENAAQKAFFDFYSVIMKALGSLVDRKAYSWLVGTINSFDKKELIRIMKESGFREIKSKSLTSGIAYLITAKK